jgi:hypothetical protein
MLFSLFVFAAPVGAAPADQAGFIDIHWDFTYTGNDKTNLTDVWYRAPGVYQGEELPGVMRKYQGRLFFYDIDGTFGPGTAILDFNSQTNYQSGKRVDHSTWYLT